MFRPSPRRAANRWWRQPLLWSCPLLLLAVGCTQHMANQPYYRPYEASSFFTNGTSARPLPTDTVARGELRADQALYTGKQQGTLVDRFPFPIDRAVLERGQERFNIYCSPCHGEAGYGDGVVVKRGFSPPPSYHVDRLRQAPVGHFFDVITNGLGPMPSYATQVPVYDRWAIIAYIRALQLSQDATVGDLPPEVRSKLEAEP